MARGSQYTAGTVTAKVLNYIAAQDQDLTLTQVAQDTGTKARYGSRIYRLTATGPQRVKLYLAYRPEYRLLSSFVRGERISQRELQRWSGLAQSTISIMVKNLISQSLIIPYKGDKPRHVLYLITIKGLQLQRELEELQRSLS